MSILPADSIQRLPPELVALVLSGLRPRSLRQFGETCRAYHTLAVVQRTTTDYGGMLARGALQRIADEIVKNHSCCRVSSQAFLRSHALAFAESEIAAKLLGEPPQPAGNSAPPEGNSALSEGDSALPEGDSTLLAQARTTAPISEWDHVALLRFLFPIVAALPDGWELAPYALEWCAENEWRVRGEMDSTAPQEEILALLHDDAVERLLRLAENLRWTVGAAFLKLALAARASVSTETYTMLSAALRVARGYLTPVWPVSIAVAVEAATLHLCAKTPPKEATPAWMRLGRVRSAKQLAWKAGGPPGIYNWVSLVGIKPGSERSPWRLIEKFVCKPDSDASTEVVVEQYARAFVSTMYEMFGPQGFVRFARRRTPPEMLVALTLGLEEGSDGSAGGEEDPGAADVEGHSRNGAD